MERVKNILTKGETGHDEQLSPFLVPSFQKPFATDSSKKRLQVGNGLTHFTTYSKYAADDFWTLSCLKCGFLFITKWMIYWKEQLLPHNAVINSFSDNGNIELFANNTDSGESARVELSHLKSALFAI